MKRILAIFGLTSFLAIAGCGQTAPVESLAEDAPTALVQDVPTETTADLDAAENTDATAEAIPTSLPDWVSDFQDYLTARMDAEHIPGLAYALILPGSEIFAEGLGLRDMENKLPVTARTLFHIGSTQKSMNAMMIAAMVDLGYFDWDTHVADIFPNFELSSANYTGQVTMVHLLSMTSGIPDYAEDDLELDGASQADVLDAVAGTDLLFSPGGVFSYSNLSATVAGYAAGYAWTGKDVDLVGGYAEALIELVLEPIGMESASFSVSEARNSEDFSYAYVMPDGRNAERAESYDLDRDPLGPSGTLKISVLDMAKYVATQLNEGVAPNGNRVVSAENLRMTWEVQLEGYALGWDRVSYGNTAVIFHTGAFDNFVSVIGFLPDLDIGLVLLVNSEDAGYALSEDAIYDLVDFVSD
jgi:CubicO group peptidase (beta-lactamase class C family)